MSSLLLLFAVLLGVLSSSVVSAVEAINGLSTYKISDATVSGLSSGGYMAVQTHIAFSSYINGSAVFAGGPFYCAMGNLMTAEYKCMKTYEGLPNVGTLVSLTNQWAKSGDIDNTEYLKNDRVYLFSGSVDSVVNPDVMHSLQTYYNNFIQVNNMVADFAVKAEHCMPTTNTNYGEACSTLGSPYIGKCAFDGVSSAFKTLYGESLTKGTAISSNLKAFNQKSYIPSGATATSIADQGYIYVPTACENGESCHLHFSFHGCMQTEADIGNDWATKTGYNDWAEANNIIIVYPYAKKSTMNPQNPNGCWDWWGYTDSNYAKQSGVQMKFFKNLYTAVSGSKST